jgi:trimeric autotransporter adhesin
LLNEYCPNYTITSNAPSTFSVGSHLVAWTVTAWGTQTNTCLQQVIVNDNESPAIVCPNMISDIADMGLCTKALTVTATATDNCNIQSITNNAPADFQVGFTMVIHTAIDTHGNTSTCQQSVEIVDNQPPTISCPSAIVAFVASGLCTTTNIDLGTPNASDNCGIMVVSNNATNLYQLGSTWVTHTVTDLHYNTASCQQEVVVFDTIRPTITCPANIVVSPQSTLCLAPVTFSPTGTDNCSIATVTTTPASGSFFNVGTTVVTATATDGSANTATCIFTVKVNPSLGITVLTPINCNGDKGLIRANPPTPVTGYTYLWSHGATTRQSGLVNAGVYTVTVTQTSTGCTTFRSYNLTQPTLLVLNTTVTQICPGESYGKIVASVTGGTGTKTYAWSHGGTSSVAQNLPAGIYTVSVTDANGCQKTQTITISGVSATALIEPATLPNKYKVTLTASGGTPYTISSPYRYRKCSTCTFGTINSFNNLVPGTYTFDVKDTKNCVFSLTLTVPALGAVIPYGQNFESVPNALESAVLSLSLRPNPASEYVQIDFDLLADTEIWVNLLDLAGRQLQSQQIIATESHTIAFFDLDELSNGIYYVELLDFAGNRRVEKLVVMK